MSNCEAKLLSPVGLSHLSAKLLVQPLRRSLELGGIHRNTRSSDSYICRMLYYMIYEAIVECFSSRHKKVPVCILHNLVLNKLVHARIKISISSHCL